MKYDDFMQKEDEDQGLNFGALVASTLHQIRFLSGQEPVEGIMFHNIKENGQEDYFQPTRYQHSVTASFVGTMDFLLCLLSPYYDEKFQKVIKSFEEEKAKAIEKAKEKLKTALEKQKGIDEIDSSRTYITERARLTASFTTRQLYPIYKSLLPKCIILVHELGLLPAVTKAKELYKEENII